MNLASADKMDKINVQAEAQKILESPRFASSETSGTTQMSIEGRFSNERARLGPDFTEADRQWRIKWFKDQQLHPKEPYDVPGKERANINFIRRISRMPSSSWNKHE